MTATSISPHFSRFKILSTALVLSSAAPLIAQELAPAQTRPLVPLERTKLDHEAPPNVEALASTPLDTVLFDTPGDGALWACGSTYKARFDGSGATIVPFFGSDAPRNFPLSLQPSSATIGGEPLDLASTAQAARDGRTVNIDHGSFVEQYALALDSLEQLFVFNTLPQRGELVLRMDIASELAASDLGSTLRFENDLGRIDYGQAFAIDAAGERIALDSQLIDGALELRVPADFVEQATLPLTIDPLVTFYTVSSTSLQEIYPDVAYDASSDRWCIAWTSVWSATDHDVFVRLATGSYTLLSTLTIDFTSETWTTAKVANNNGSDVFLVVAAAVPASGISEIRGRIVHPATEIVDAPFNVTPVDGAYRNWPDIGGDPYPTSPSYFCVVFQRSVSANNVDIEKCMVSPNGTVYGIAPLENSSGWHEHPYISSSLGEDSDGEARWTVTWQHQYSPSDHDIYGAQMSWGGAIITPMFPIETSTWDETEPMASTVLDSTTLGGPRTYVVVYERDYGSDHDILGAVLEDSNLLRVDNLVGPFGPSAWYHDQRIPAIDSDGSQFLVGFVERDTPSSYNSDIWMCNYFWTGSELVPSELRKSFAGSGQAETDIALHSMASSGGPQERYLGSWVFENPTTSYDVVAGLWDGFGGGPVESFCAGDGTAGTCPCSNHGAAGHGCRNSANASGALLTSSGNASVAHDTFVLSASGMPNTAPSLFFQTPGSSSPAPFGDGLRCATGPALRFPLQQNSGGASSYPTSGATPIHAYLQFLSAGDTRYYQTWYRDPANFCTTSTYNLSNALQVIWAP